MSVQLLVVADCPNERRAASLLSDAVRLLGWSGEFVETITIASLEQAEAWGFTGSPSFFLNGVDVLPEAGGEPALACRVYLSATASVAGCPAVSDLAAALTSAAHAGLAPAALAGERAGSRNRTRADRSSPAALPTLRR